MIGRPRSFRFARLKAGAARSAEVTVTKATIDNKVTGRRRFPLFSRIQCQVKVCDLPHRLS
eukprot:3874501-Pyramimonas_sp.AAC.1